LNGGNIANSLEHKARISAVLALSLLLLALCSLPFASFCYAATPREEYKKIQKEIGEHKKKLKKAERREYSVLADLEKTNRQLSRVETELRKYRRRLTDIESNILKVEAEIAMSKKNIEKRKEWIKRKLRAMQKYGHTSNIVMLFLSTDDISQLMRKVKFLQRIAVYENRILDNYKEDMKDLCEKEKELLNLKAELIKNKEKVREEEISLARSKRNKELLLASVKKEKYSYTKMLEELKATSKKILKVIRESEETDTFSAKGFSKLKGKLPWPVKGKVVIPYGSQKDPQFNTPVFKSGAYIQPGDDSLAKAVYKGKVVFAEWFKGYGQLVIISHGEGYHTLYGSLSEIFTKVGDIIEVKQIIGRVGNSGILNVSGLYFELRYKGKPLDPLQWLEKR
jgi:septal ring factor EnvC (AmiA/AmiB activator)